MAAMLRHQIATSKDPLPGLLSLPQATTSGRTAPLADALFTAVSAVCVTGLSSIATLRG